MIDPLPTPEGPERTTTAGRLAIAFRAGRSELRLRRALAAAAARGRAPSLNVLHLLAKLLELDLHRHDRVAHRGVHGLRAHGVRLAEHLLNEEVELAADVARRLLQHRDELLDVA